MSKRWKFVRWFLISYLIVLIPVMLVSFNVATQTIVQLREQTHENITARVERAREELEGMCVDYAGGSASLMMDAALMGEFWSQNIKRYKSIQTLQSVGKYDMRASVIFVYTGQREVFATTGYASGANFFGGSSLSLSEESALRAIETMRSAVNAATAIHKVRSSNGYLLLHYPNNVGSYKSDVSVNYLIDFATIGNMLRAISPDCPIGVRLSFSDGSQMLYAGDGDDLAAVQALPSELNEAALPISSEVRAMNARIEVYYDEERLYAQVRTGQALSTGILIGGMLISTLISILFSARRLRRLQLLEDASEGKEVAFKREDEYTFIGRMLTSSAMKLSEMAASAQSDRDIIKRQTVLLLLNGAVRERALANELLRACGMELCEECYCVGGIAMEAPEHVFDNALKRMRADLVCSARIQGRRIIAYIEELPNPDIDRERRISGAQARARMLNELGARNVYVGISQVYQDIRLAETAFREVIELLVDRDRREEITCYETAMGTDMLFKHLDREQLRNFMDSLQERDADKAWQAFESMSQSIEAGNYNASDKAYLLDCILRAMIDEFSEAPDENVELMQAVSQVDVKDERRYPVEVKQILKDYVKEKGFDAKAVADYIAQRYADSNLSASDVAAFLGINKANLSRLFKANFGKSYIEYLSGIRLEKARELLINSDLTIEEIVARVGYCDHSSFRRKFKAEYGVSVGDFR